MDLVITERVSSESAREYVYKILKSNILTLNLKPGTHITEKDISDFLNISRTPVREALIKLSQENLLNIYPQKGTVVSLIDLNHLTEAVFIRKTLECEIMQQACASFPEKLLIDMQANINQMEFQIKQSAVDVLSVFDLDKGFHKYLFIGTKNTLAWNVIKQISSHLDRARILKMLTVDRAWENVTVKHTKLVLAIASQNQEEGSFLMNEHIGHFDGDAAKLFTKHRDFFK